MSNPLSEKETEADVGRSLHRTYDVYRKPKPPLDFMDKNNKLTLPIAILIASVIVGGFIYASQMSKQQSIEKQQQAELQAKKDQDNAIAQQKSQETSQKTLCASEAVQSAIDLNKSSCARGEYCIQGEGMYSVGQYNNIYNVCLQSKGLK